MTENFYKKVTLDQFSSDEAVFKRVYKYLVWRSAKYFAMWGLPILEGRRGKAPEDIASEAVEQVLSPNSKFDPSLGNLVGYLAQNLIKGKVANLAKRKAVRMEDVVGDQEEWDNEEAVGGIDDHAKLVLEKVECALQGDKEAEGILYGKVAGMKRGEIMKEFGLDAGQYLNAYRRMKSKIERLGVEELKKYLL